MKTRAAFIRIVSSLALLGLVVLGVSEFRQVAAGTQNWIGKFTLTWGLALAGMGLAGVGMFAWALGMIWVPEKLEGASRYLSKARNLTGWFRWILILLVAFIPAKILLYTPLGFKLTGVGFRLILFIISGVLVSILATRDERKLIDWHGFFLGVILLGSVFAFAKAFITVVDYPLSITWSEGNRIWDYSILFGRERYIYPDNKPIEAYIDTGRQTLWGLPFLMPNISLVGVRLWSALVFTVPYALLGWVALRPVKGQYRQWLVFGLFSFIFINQGPVYTPLILSAILVVGARRKPLWIAIPLIFLAGLYAQKSRITWMAAPAIWGTLIALLDANTQDDGKISLKRWGFILAYGLSGLFGGFGLIRGWRRLYNYITRAIAANAVNDPNTASMTPTPAAAPETVFVSPSDAAEVISSGGQETFLSNQPVVISRLFPNPTYNLGILLGLLLAAGPILVLLVYLIRRRHWKLNIWQQTGLYGSLAALMLVGIIISTKIGGGGDLHNLDMFLISVILALSFAWESGGYRWLQNLRDHPLGIRVALVLAIAIPAFMPWISAEPLELPPQDKVEWTMDLLRSETSRVVAEGGEILFMDQRQLLTFGYLGDIPLVPEYEKKLVMDRVMSGNQAYFEDFYRDISSQRFALIISDPQRIRYADEDEGWGVENDTWVEWVTRPLLCYYDPVYTIKKTGVWLLEPTENPGDCPVP